ncbi:MAG: hypothetical protein M1820_001501 [Bogoriella megaspora]|nr:MAG: hypothetical protein M1820_001501 [Bogoriella megaspora]
MVICRILRVAFDSVQFWAYLQTCPGPPKASPLRSRDVTVIIPTLGTESRLIHTVKSWLDVEPGAIIIVTTSSSEKKLQEWLSTLHQDKIRLLSVPKAAHREQLVKAIQNVSTSALFVTNDRSFCSKKSLDYLCEAFSDGTVGGVTLPCIIKPAEGATLNTWESFGALNQVRRTILHSALSYLHSGQVLNLAGAAAGYRTHILQNEMFYQYFLNETWLRRFKITSADDNTMTRWTVQGGWRTYFPNMKEAVIFSSVAPNSNYLRQVKRWSRDTARSYLKDVHFAIRSRQRRAFVHVGLNIAANYASDLAILTELSFLLIRFLALKFANPTLHQGDKL